MTGYGYVGLRASFSAVKLPTFRICIVADDLLSKLWKQIYAEFQAPQKVCNT